MRETAGAVKRPFAVLQLWMKPLTQYKGTQGREGAKGVCRKGFHGVWL